MEKEHDRVVHKYYSDISNNPKYSSKEEKLAEYYARNLLMPKDLFIKENNKIIQELVMEDSIKNNKDEKVKRLSYLFAIPEDMALERIKELEL